MELTFSHPLEEGEWTCPVCVHSSRILMLIPWTLSQNFFLKAQRKHFSGWLHCVQTTETKNWVNFSVKITVLCAAGAPAVWGAADTPELCCPLLPPAAQDRHHCIREIRRCSLSLPLITLYFIAHNPSCFYFVDYGKNEKRILNFHPQNFGWV